MNFAPPSALRFLFRPGIASYSRQGGLEGRMFQRRYFQRFRRFPVAALWLVFFINGAVLSSWAPRIPEVKAQLGLSDAELGLALFGVAAGAVPALLLTDRLLRRVGSRIVCLMSAAVFATALPLIAAASSALTLGLVLALLGAASGALDVAMNTAGIEHQHHRQSTPIISRLHGGYSLGVLSGATGGAAATVAGVSVLAHFVLTTAILLALLAAAGVHLPTHRTLRSHPDDMPAPRVSLSQAITVLIATVAIAGLLLEGMVTDWSALLVSRDFGAGILVGSTVVVVFSLAMFMSRSAGDWVVTKLGRSRYLVVAGITAVLGTSIGLLPGWAAGYAGLVLVGLVLGPVFPLAINVAADRAPTAVSAAAAAVSAVGYLAYLGGPPVIGLLAHTVGLPVTVALFGSICGVALVITAARMRPDSVAV